MISEGISGLKREFIINQLAKSNMSFEISIDEDQKDSFPISESVISNNKVVFFSADFQNFYKESKKSVRIFFYYQNIQFYFDTIILFKNSHFSFDFPDVFYKSEDFVEIEDNGIHCEIYFATSSKNVVKFLFYSSDLTVFKETELENTKYFNLIVDKKSPLKNRIRPFTLLNISERRIYFGSVNNEDVFKENDSCVVEFIINQQKSLRKIQSKVIIAKVIKEEKTNKRIYIGFFHNLKKEDFRYLYEKKHNKKFSL